MQQKIAVLLLMFGIIFHQEVGSQWSWKEYYANNNAFRMGFVQQHSRFAHHSPSYLVNSGPFRSGQPGPLFRPNVDSQEVASSGQIDNYRKALMEEQQEEQKQDSTPPRYDLGENVRSYVSVQVNGQQPYGYYL